MRIEELIEKWYYTRKQISELKKQEENYRQVIMKYMEQHNTVKINTNQYECSLKKQSRKQLDKKNLPEEIINKYSVEKTYNTVYIKKL